VVKKNNIVLVRRACVLGSSFSEEYIICIFRGLSENGGSMFFFRMVFIIDDLVSLWNNKVSLLFGLK